MGLTIPDAFVVDPYGWATNQMAHALLGLAVAAALAWLLGAVMTWALGGPVSMRGPAVLIMTVVYFVGWEAVWQRFGAGMGDALVDTAFMGLGGALGVSAWGRKGAAVLAAMGLTIAGLAIGIWRRVRR